MLLGFMESLLIVGAAVLVFRIPCAGSLWSLFFSLLLFLFSVVGFGLFISSLCNTQQQAILGTFTFMMPATLISGFATPIESMPQFLQIVSWANPMRHFLVAVRGIMLKGMPFGTVLGIIWPLAVIAVATLALANWFFRRGLR
jgi:ABC-2 type transport system permease protein